jgi:hypothetical protein
LAGDNRRLKLDALVTAGKISPAERDEIAEAFLKPEQLALSLQHKKIDGFDRMIAIRAKHDLVTLGEHTPGQTVVPLALSLANTEKEDASALAMHNLMLRDMGYEPVAAIGE